MPVAHPCTMTPFPPILVEKLEGGISVLGPGHGACHKGVEDRGGCSQVLGSCERVIVACESTDGITDKSINLLEIELWSTVMMFCHKPSSPLAFPFLFAAIESACCPSSRHGHCIHLLFIFLSQPSSPLAVHLARQSLGAKP